MLWSEYTSRQIDYALSQALQEVRWVPDTTRHHDTLDEHGNLNTIPAVRTLVPIDKQERKLSLLDHLKCAVQASAGYLWDRAEHVALWSFITFVVGVLIKALWP